MNCAPPVCSRSCLPPGGPEPMAMIKRPDEIDRLAESGRLLAQVFAMLDALPLQGRSTLEINAEIAVLNDPEKEIREIFLSL